MGPKIPPLAPFATNTNREILPFPQQVEQLLDGVRQFAPAHEHTTGVQRATSVTEAPLVLNSRQESLGSNE